jgi:uncharacterized phage protein gp47/JayE
MPPAPNYVAPYIDPNAGLVLPSYQSIINSLISGYQAIYPQVVYLGTDTAKYQEISIFALKCYDSNLASQLAYNARSPSTAIGADLDSIVKMNGIARLPASYSTAPLTVTGAGGTIITNGQVTDIQGYVWALPISVTIPSGGSVTVGVTCQTAGAIQAQAGSINTISQGATAGWTGATNPSPALPGLPTESDSQLRARQALSVAAPALTRLASTIAAIAAVPGVTRYATGTPTPDSGPGSSIENPTGSIDFWGNPPHSISMVVEGGSNLAIATAIYQKRGLGVYTNPDSTAGSTSVPVTDPNTGTVTTIGFQRPTYAPIYATMVIHGLQGYTSATLAAVQSAIVSYLNSLQIGETVTYSSFYSVAQSVMPSLVTPQFSITSLRTGLSASPSGTTDITLDYYQVAQGISGNIVVTEM